MQLRIERRMVPHVPWGLIVACSRWRCSGIYNLASASRAPHSPGVDDARRSTWASAWSRRSWCRLVDYRFIQRMAVPIYVVNILALLALRVIGHKAKGAESWFVLGPIRIQPAEFMKIGVHADAREVLPRRLPARTMAPTGSCACGSRCWWCWCPSVLVLVQPDLGTALMIVLSSADGHPLRQVRWYLVAIVVVGCSPGAGIIWNDYVREVPEPRTTVIRHLLKKHQSKRISGWLDPEADLRGSGYHAAQSKIAVGSGGLHGKGWKEGTQTGLFFLPEQHTDFIFSVWAEEHGFLACLLLLVLYGLIFSFALGVALQRPGPLRRVRRGGRGGDDLLAGVREHRDGDRPACR